MPALVAAAVGTAGVGAVLALAGVPAPLRAPFTVFFLLAAPAAALAASLGGLDPLGRAVAALGGALALDLLTAQAMLMLRLWSASGGVMVVAVLSAELFLLPLARRGPGRPARGRA